MSFVSLTDEHKPSGNELFLDTSIHCSLKKGPLFTGRIKSVFSLFKWKSASSYSKVEYGNNVLSHAEYYIKKIELLGSLRKAIDFVGNVLRDSGASGGHRHWAFNLLIPMASDNDAEATERALLSLRRLMKHGVQFVDSLCDNPIQNGTGCYWAAKGVYKKRNGTLEWRTPNCKRELKRCKVDEFFVENLSVFEKIKAAIDALPEGKSKQLSQFSEIIAQAKNDPGCLLNYRTGCKKLADAIIAVDSQGFRNMFSQNSAESTLLCELLKQTFYYLPPNEEKGVLVQLYPPTQS